jgi:hypothetical protein
LILETCGFEFSIKGNYSPDFIFDPEDVVNEIPKKMSLLSMTIKMTFSEISIEAGCLVF